MNSGKYIFSQLVDFLPKRVFDMIVKRHNGDKWVKTFTCRNKLLVMMYGQLAFCDSLREVACIVDSIKNKSYYLGFGVGEIKLSNLSYANVNRDYKIFEEYAYFMINLAQIKRIDRPFELHGKFYAFHSTTIDLCLSLFKWAYFRKNKGASKSTIRQKSHLKYEVVDGEELLDGADNVLFDQTIRLTGYQTRKKYPSLLRRIVYYAPDLQRTFTFLTSETIDDVCEEADQLEFAFKC